LWVQINNALRYFVHIGYKGTNFRGWQRQPLVSTVQEVIEFHLSKVLGKTIVCIGCGRTDAQVHASQYFFHFDFDTNWDFDLKFRLNKTLPDDISVFDIIPVDGYPHAQLNATSRTYDYLFHTQKNPFLIDYSSFYQLELNIDAMVEAVSLIPKYQNFVNFCRCPNHYPNHTCRVTSCKLFMHPNGKMFRFQITSNRFIRGMVRLLVNSIIDIGAGKLNLSDFENYLSTSDTPKLIKPAHPQGLYLSKVTYNFFENENYNNNASSITFIDSINWKLL
jgi:tRNA pseudouridine38-40 synthase